MRILVGSLAGLFALGFGAAAILCFLDGWFWPGFWALAGCLLFWYAFADVCTEHRPPRCAVCLARLNPLLCEECYQDRAQAFVPEKAHPADCECDECWAGESNPPF